jgi:hypothetical protein
MNLSICMNTTRGNQQENRVFNEAAQLDPFSERSKRRAPRATVTSLDETLLSRMLVRGVLTHRLTIISGIVPSGVENQVAKSFVKIEDLPSYAVAFVLSEPEKQMHAEKIRMMNAINKSFWNGIAARDRQLEDRGIDLWTTPFSRSQFQDQILKAQASKGGQAAKADWLTLEIRRIVDRNPEVSENDLRNQLSKLDEVEFLSDTDMPVRHNLAIRICYMSHGRWKKIPCSGLKDRLSRTKKIRAKRIARLN